MNANTAAAIGRGIVLADGDAVIVFEAKVKAETVHRAIDLAEAQANLVASNRGKYCSFTRYEITNAEPTDVIAEKLWTILYS